MGLTQTSEKVALHCLSQFDWKLDQAVDHFYSHPDMYFGSGGPARHLMGHEQSRQNQVDKKKLEQFYAKYKGTTKH